MATIIDLKEHIENGGKIRRPSWGKDTYICLYDDEFTEAWGLGYTNKELLFDDWEVYEEPFKIMHTGLYKTRDGRKAFVSYISPSKTSCSPILGVVEDEVSIMKWTMGGVLWINEENPKDIVAEWED